MGVDRDSSDSLPGSSNAAAEKPDNESPDPRCQEKGPKKTHKAEREKLKRDQLNDLFLELSSMLDLDRQNSGKASVLGDAARVMRDLITQVESLRKEHSSLLAERQYVSSEKNELQEENNMIKARISELQNELRAKVGNSGFNITSLGMSHSMMSAASPDLVPQPIQHQTWSNFPNLTTMTMMHTTNTVSPLHTQPLHHSADVAQACLPRPQELQLFPGTSSSPERECSRPRSAQAASPSLTDPLPGQLRLSLPQSPRDENNSGPLSSRKER